MCDIVFYDSVHNNVLKSLFYIYCVSYQRNVELYMMFINVLVFNQLDGPRPCMYSLNSYIFLTILFAHPKKKKKISTWISMSDLIH